MRSALIFVGAKFNDQSGLFVVPETTLTGRVMTIHS